MTSNSAFDFLLPDVGEGLEEAEIVGWKVSVGQQIEVNQPMVEIESAKSLVELPSPYAGTVLELLAKEGEIVKVGTSIIRIQINVSEQSAAGKDDTNRTEFLVGSVSKGEESRRQRRAPRTYGRDVPSPQVARTDSSPPATQSGENSRETRTPIRGVRRAMAEAMVASAFTAPHVTEWVTVDVTASMQLLEELRTQPEFVGIHFSPLPLLARAMCIAARQTPEVNSFWDASAQEIVTKHYVNLGIATATDRGLLVPNVKNAGQLNLKELTVAIAEVVDAARAGKTEPAQMTGGTMSITNIGIFGIDAGTPILPPGQSAIISLGAVVERPWVVDGKIVVRHVITLALSFDHRLVDGAQGSKFLSDIAQMLQEPVEIES